jgi:DNA-directed RNA polymerase specialized sigma54-like protein
MPDPLNKSQSDATFLRMLANEFATHQPTISRVTEGKFCFSATALKLIADRVEENGYKDDQAAEDIEKTIRDRVYGTAV